MFKLFFMMSLALASVVCYDEKFDKMDFDAIIADDALFETFTDCLLDKGECTIENSAEIKEVLPEVIATACEKCTPKQRENIRKTVKAVQEKTTLFPEIQAKYDPKGEHTEKFAQFLLSND